MDAKRKALEEYSKMVEEGLPFSEDFISKSKDIEDNALMARNLSEEALAHQVLKNTGIPIPNKGAPVSKQEDFLNRIMKERYPELEPNVRFSDTAGADYHKGNIELNKYSNELWTPERKVGTVLHEAGHQYDDQILNKIGQNLDLKTLRDAQKSGIDLKNMDPTQVYELYAKAHHSQIPDLRQGTFGLGALKSYLKSGTFKSLPYIGTAAALGAGLTSPDASAAVGDALVPGGLESLGPSAEDAAIENPQANSEARREALRKLSND